MKVLVVSALALLLLGCGAERAGDTSADAVTATTTPRTDPSQAPAMPTAPAENAAVDTAANENQVAGTWAGQVKLGQPVSMFNYVGAESGDFAPMRFRNDSEAGRKILATCSDDDMCELTGVVEWLDEPPPPDASAIGEIVRVDAVKRLPPGDR